MLKPYAVIRANQVQTVIAWEGDGPHPDHPGATLIPVEGNLPDEIDAGWKLADDGSWTDTKGGSHQTPARQKALERQEAQNETDQSALRERNASEEQTNGEETADTGSRRRRGGRA